MKKISQILCILLVSIVVVQCDSEKRAIHNKLTEMVQNLNESTPVMLDKYTRFDNAAVTNNNVFQYNYTVLNTQNPDSLIKNAESSLFENIRKEFETNPQLLFFKQNSVAVEYIYKDENGRLIHKIQLDSSNYN